MDPEELQARHIQDIKIITIVIDPQKDRPEIDLDSCTIEEAIAIFSKAAEILDMEIPPPKIIQNGEVVSDIFYSWDDFDED